jgi:hypothetical protein
MDAARLQAFWSRSSGAGVQEQDNNGEWRTGDIYLLFSLNFLLSLLDSIILAESIRHVPFSCLVISTWI